MAAEEERDAVALLIISVPRRNGAAAVTLVLLARAR
jgi:hypothetical protein